MKLTKLETIELIPTFPFAFDPTFYKPDHFASGDNYWQPGIRWQTMLHQGIPLGLVFNDIGTTDNPKIFLEIWGRKKTDLRFVNSLIEEIDFRYNLDSDLLDFYALFAKDPLLSPAIKRLYGMRPGHSNSLYEYLIIGILLQNCTVKRSIYMMETLFHHYGTELLFSDKKLWVFWSPGSLNKVSEDELRSLKIGYRAKAIKRIDDSFSEGLIDEIYLRNKDLSTQRTELMKLYGVGPATVWYILFDIFHQYDFFNHISPWEQKIYSRIFFNRSINDPIPIETLINYFERYGKYRQLAVHYLWEDLWWKYKNGKAPWLKELIRI
jgi:3-methyladenine DNA glycosylase/8-oxoguanine DNA glycosylase